jgi:hypothetical protein
MRMSAQISRDFIIPRRDDTYMSVARSTLIAKVI